MHNGECLADFFIAFPMPIEWFFSQFAGSKFDFNIVLSAIGNRQDTKARISILPSSGEGIKCLRYNFYTFVDTLSFLSSSLEKCVDTLKKSGSDFPYLSKSGVYKTEQQREMLIQKGIYPYE